MFWESSNGNIILFFYCFDTAARPRQLLEGFCFCLIVLGLPNPSQQGGKAHKQPVWQPEQEDEDSHPEPQAGNREKHISSSKPTPLQPPNHHHQVFKHLSLWGDILIQATTRVTGRMSVSIKTRLWLRLRAMSKWKFRVVGNGENHVHEWVKIVIFKFRTRIKVKITVRDRLIKVKARIKRGSRWGLVSGHITGNVRGIIRNYYWVWELNSGSDWRWRSVWGSK